MERIKRELKKNKVEVFITEDKFDIQYLTGIPEIEGSLLFIFKDNIKLLTNKIFLDYVSDKGNLDVSEISPEEIKKLIKNYTYAVDPYRISHISFLKLKELNKNIKLLPNFLSKIRAI